MFYRKKFGQKSLFWTCTSQFSVNPCRFRAKLSLMELGIFMLLKGAKSDNTPLATNQKERKKGHPRKQIVNTLLYP